MERDQVLRGSTLRPAPIAIAIGSSALESEMQRMSDDELRCRMPRFNYRLQSG